MTPVGCTIGVIHWDFGEALCDYRNCCWTSSGSVLQEPAEGRASEQTVSFLSFGFHYVFMCDG
jgi:hypothetical protein